MLVECFPLESLGICFSVWWGSATSSSFRKPTVEHHFLFPKSLLFIDFFFNFCTIESDTAHAPNVSEFWNMSMFYLAITLNKKQIKLVINLHLNSHNQTVPNIILWECLIVHNLCLKIILIWQVLQLEEIK